MAGSGARAVGGLLLLVMCLGGHVGVSMARSLEGARMGSGRSVLQQEYGDAQCKLVGEAVASIAFAFACHKVKLMCNILDTSETKKRKEISHYAELAPHCMREAKSSCRTTVTKLINDNVDSECAKLLDKGPDNPVENCWNWQQAVDEFNWTIRGVCQDDASMHSKENSGG